jgi:hypothetical protein
MLGIKLLINIGDCHCQLSSEALAKFVQALPFARKIANGLGYAVLVEKAGHFLEKVGLVWKKPYFFSVGQV